MYREEVPLVEWLGYRIRGIRIPFELQRWKRCYYYMPFDDEPWDLIAWKFYNKESLWYIIADVNGVADPFVYPKSTERLAVPEIY